MHPTPVTLETLKRFCAIAGVDRREHLHNPITIDGWLCATNGHLVIATPATTGEEHAAAPDFVLKGIRPIRQMWEQVTDDLWQPWSTLHRDSRPAPQCDHCQGSGWVTVTGCTHCNGEGEFQHHGLLYDCQNCDSYGALEKPATAQTPEATPCEECDARGAVWDSLITHLPGIARFGMQELYATQLHALPGIEWAPPHHSKTECGAIPIRFHGGWGAVMPYRIKSKAKRPT